MFHKLPFLLLKQSYEMNAIIIPILQRGNGTSEINKFDQGRAGR